MKLLINKNYFNNIIWINLTIIYFVNKICEYNIEEHVLFANKRGGKNFALV
jgi:hypothetical protein